MDGHRPFFQSLLSQSHFPHSSDAFLSTPNYPPTNLLLRRICRPLTISDHHRIVHVTPMDSKNQIPHNSRHKSTSRGREDCWSESGTETLIEAWGDRYLQLNRGKLRQKDWNDVADAVNANRDELKPRRTDAQCKNRIDTLKKKYRLEKSKSVPSKWPIFQRLDDLIGTANTVTRKKIRTTKSSSVTLTVKSNSTLNPNPNLKLKAATYSGGSLSLNFTEGITAYEELASAILRFGEVYERIENSKQEEMMKLEKQRMEFTREVEFQRLNLFMDTQLELEKMKKKKKKPSDSFRSGKKSEL